MQRTVQCGALVFKRPRRPCGSSQLPSAGPVRYGSAVTYLLHVKEYMESRTHAVHEADDVHEVVRTLVDKGITGVPVVDVHDAVVGMLTERECLRLLTHPSEELKIVGELMNKEVTTVEPDMDVAYVAGLFNKHPDSRRFAVVQDGKLCGVVTRKDILRAIVAMGR